MIWIPDNGVPIYEVPESEFNSWKEAHNFKGAVATKACENILRNMKYPTETFAEASARLGYGNKDNPKTKQWYYDRGIYILSDEEIQQTKATTLQT